MNGKSTLIVALASFNLVACGRFSLERSSHTEIKTNVGKLLYINRLARGVDYDVLWLTARAGECLKPSESDIILGDGGMSLFYRIEGDGSVRIFVQGHVDVPSDFPVRIEQQDVHPLDWPEIEKRHESGDIRRISLAVSSSDPCLTRW